MPAVIRLTERNLDATFHRTPWMLVRVDRVPPTLHPGLAEYLDRRFPNLFTFATASRTDFSAARLAELLQSGVGRLRAGIADGYYLLEAGLVVGNHSGQPRPSSVSYGSEREEQAQRARILAATPVGADRMRPQDTETLRQIVAYLEPIVERRQRAAGFGDDGFSTAGGGPTYVYTDTAPPPPGRAAAAPRADDPDDPHVVLGVSPGATQEEIRAAFKEQLKLNHPDKVAHLSPALQAFAAQQTLKLKDAYERLTRRG